MKIIQYKEFFSHLESIIYRCVQHVDCQYEMRIYLISHETCYVQHRGYHTEEKQKYKRPGKLIVEERIFLKSFLFLI